MRNPLIYNTTRPNSSDTTIKEEEEEEEEEEEGHATGREKNGGQKKG